MDQDSGGQEDLTDEGIAKFLEEAIGGELVDPEFIDEFKSSDLFDAFLTQLHPFPGGGGTPQSSSSRRASLTESEKEKYPVTFPTKNEESAEGHREEVPSTSKAKDPKKSADHVDTQQKKRKSNQHTEKIGIHLDQSREKTDYKKPHKKKAESPEKMCSQAVSSWPVIREVYTQHKPERKVSPATPVVRLFDLTKMKRQFPNGLNKQSMPVIANQELMQAIRNFESSLLSLEACRKLERLKKAKRSSGISGGKEKQKISQLEDRVKNCATVTSGSSSPSNAKKKIAAVLENVQSIEKKEKHQISRCNESFEEGTHHSSRQVVSSEVPAAKKTKTSSASNVAFSINNKISNSRQPVSKEEMSTMIVPAPSHKQVHSSLQPKTVSQDLEQKKKEKGLGVDGVSLQSQSHSASKSPSESLDLPETKRQRLEKEGSLHYPASSSQEASKEKNDAPHHSKKPALENIEKKDSENFKDSTRKKSSENVDASGIIKQPVSSVSVKLDLRIPPLELVKRKEPYADPLPKKGTLKLDNPPQVPDVCVELTTTESHAKDDKVIKEKVDELQSPTDHKKVDISSKVVAEAAQEGVPKQSLGRKSVSPEKASGRKSASPERIVYKRKNVIESSSDDDIKRTDTGDETDGGPERKKSSDEEQARKSVGFERKRDQADPRSKKFDKFEHERQRKLGEIKKGKEKPKENVALDDVLKEKPLIGSFRIPKKTTAGILRRPKAQLTPLATADVPKENLQFERSRKGTDKEKRDKDFSWGRQQDHTDGPKYGDRFKKDQESAGQSFRNRFTDKDDGRVVVLAPEAKKQEEHLFSPPSKIDPPLFSPPSKIEPPVEPEESEPQWANDGEELGEGATSSSSSEEEYISVVDTTNVKPDLKISPPQVEEDSKDVEPDPVLDPEVPIKEPQENAVTVGAVYLIKDGDKVDLPDIDVLESNDVTVMRLAWWLSRMDSSSVVESDSDCDDNSDSDGASFLHKLEFTESDEEELFPNDSTDPRRKPHQGLVDEVCGRSLLSAQLRSGPGDTFFNIFNLRSGASYEKENFQAKCSLCACLVVGKKQLADHVDSESHKAKMSKAGLGDEKCDNGVVPPEKKSKEAKVKVECDKTKDSDDKKTSSSSKQKESPRTEIKEKKKDGDTRGKEERVRRNPSPEPEKRKRPKDDVSDEGTRKNKAEANASGAKAERRKNRSRSRSPRHNPTRSRSPRRRSRSPRAQRRRSRSIQRIPRSPSKIQEAREQRRRSTSAERVQKFLAKTNKRSRSRSPSKGHSRKRRRSRSKSPTGLGMPRRDNLEFNQKLVLTAAGKWTDEMEGRWKLMEAEQAIFMEQHGEKKKQLNDAPESHPTYPVEWEAFWQKRYGEVQDKGLDPDSYDYVPEWKEYWTKKLRNVLKDQYEKGIKEIKERHGLDLDSLHKILAHEPNKLVSSVAGGVEVVNPASVSTPAYKFTPSTPSSVPFSIPPPSVPQSAPSNPASVTQLPSSISSKTSGNDDDFTARSMSISDGGSERGASTVKSPNGVSNTPTITVGDIMSKWEKLKSGELPASPGLPLAQPAVRNIMSKSKNSDNMSETDSGSIASYDFDGFELTQVLRYMTNLEDQLSFFADKVKEYFKKAEELDLKKKNRSLTLLDDEDFVVMLFNVRDRFMAMIRANILSKDILKSLNYTVYALNSILDAPQCKKHHSKVANASASSALEKEINHGLPKTANSQTKEISSVKSRNPLMNLSSSKKEKIAVLVTEFLQNMGKESLSDADLQKLLHTLLSPVSDAENAGGPQSKGVSGASENKRPTGRSSDATTHEFSSIDPWGHQEQRSMTKTCSVVTTQVAGKGAPTLPEVIVPQAVFDRGPLGARDDVWDSSTSRDRDNNYASSSSESGRRSPFSRRGFAGNPTSNPFRDKGIPLHMPLQAERESRHSISAIDDILLRGRHGVNTGQGIRRSDQEIRLGQITSGISLNHGQSSLLPTPGFQRSTMEAYGEHSSLPAGIRNLIMKEREKKSQNYVQMKVSSPKLSSEEETYSRRERHKKRKTKRERKRFSHYSDSDISSGSETDYRSYDSGKRKRKRRKRRKDENEDRERRKRPSAALSDVSSIKSVQLLQTRRKELQSDDSSSLRESNRMDNITSRLRESREPEPYRVAPPAPMNVFVEPHQGRHRANVRINMPNLALRSGDQVQDGPSSRKACTDKVTSVSKTFWTSELEGDKELSSISSNDLKEQEPAEETGETQLKKQTRSYRLSTDKAAKEPGEITDDSDSSISSQDNF